MNRSKRDTPSWKDWSTLVVALRQRTTISSAELSDLVSQHTDVSANYALRRLQREGVLGKMPGGRKAVYLVAKTGSTSFIKDPVEAAQAICGADVLFGYGTALFLHGLSRYGRLTETYVVGRQAARQQEMEGLVVRTIKSPLRADVGVASQQYQQRLIRVTDLERTLIDCVHRPKYAQGWENVVHALHRASGVKPEKMIAYVKRYRTPSLVAKVGLLLEHFGKKWKVATEELGSLRSYLPREPVKFGRQLGGTLHKEWKLYVPEGVFDE